MAQYNSSNGFNGASFSDKIKAPASPITRTASELARHECPKGRKAFTVQVGSDQYFTYSPNQDNALSRVAKLLGFRVSQLATLKAVTPEQVQGNMNALPIAEQVALLTKMQAELEARVAAEAQS